MKSGKIYLVTNEGLKFEVPFQFITILMISV
jgi:hypothetical protein